MKKETNKKECPERPGCFMFVTFCAKCKGCGREIVFLRTATGNAIPVNKETTDAVDEYFDKDRHVSHFADCPEANRFRKAEK